MLETLLPAPCYLQGAVSVIAFNTGSVLEWSITSVIGRATLMQWLAAWLSDLTHSVRWRKTYQVQA